MLPSFCFFHHHLSIHHSSIIYSFICPLFVHLFSIYPSSINTSTHHLAFLFHTFMFIHCSSIHVSIHLFFYSLSIFHQTLNYSSIPIRHSSIIYSPSTNHLFTHFSIHCPPIHFKATILSSTTYLLFCPQYYNLCFLLY